MANEAKHLQFEGGNTEADKASTHQKRRPKNSSVTDVEALTTWQQKALIRTSVATNATKLDTAKVPKQGLGPDQGTLMCWNLTAEVVDLGL